MNTIINYLLSVDGLHRPIFEARIGEHFIFVTQRDDAFHVSCDRMDGDELVRTFSDAREALEYVQNCVKGITDAE